MSQLLFPAPPVSAVPVRGRAGQRRPWDLGKDVEESAVISEIVPATEIGHPTEGRIELRLNDETKQLSDLSIPTAA